MSAENEIFAGIFAFIVLHISGLGMNIILKEKNIYEDIRVEAKL